MGKKNKSITNLNRELQTYKGIPFRLIERYDYHVMQAKRFTLNETNQNVWIPNKHLLEDGTLREGENVDYVFRSRTRQLEIAGITQAIPGIKRRNATIKEEVF